MLPTSNIKTSTGFHPKFIICRDHWMTSLKGLIRSLSETAKHQAEVQFRVIESSALRSDLPCKRTPCSRSYSIVSLVHSWHRRRGCAGSILLRPSYCFSGGGFASHMALTRGKSLIAMTPISLHDSKVASNLGLWEVSLISRLNPFIAFPVALNMVPSSFSPVLMKIAWWFRGMPMDSTR